MKIALVETTRWGVSVGRRVVSLPASTLFSSIRVQGTYMDDPESARAKNLRARPANNLIHGRDLRPFVPRQVGVLRVIGVYHFDNSLGVGES